jgi:hypothetical protein
VNAAPGGVRGKDADERRVGEAVEVGGGEEVREEEERPGARAYAAAFVAAAPAVTLSGKPIGRQIWVTRAPRLPMDGGDAEDTLDRALRAELRATVAPGGARGKDAKEGRVGEAVEVGGGKEVREEGRGEAAEGSQGRGDRCLCLFSFVFIRVCAHQMCDVSKYQLLRYLLFKFL